MKRKKKKLFLTIAALFLCALLAACGTDGSATGDITAPEDVLKMAEACVGRHIEVLEKRGVAYVPEDPAEPGQQMVHLSTEESHIATLKLLESRDVTQRLSAVEGYSQISSGAIEVYELAYRLKPKAVPDLEKIVTLDDDGWMTFDDDVLLALRAGDRYIELAENLYSRQTYDDDWSLILERSLGSDIDPELLKTGENFTWKLGNTTIGLGLYKSDAPLPLAFDYGEGVSAEGPFHTGKYVMSYEKSSFLMETVNYYEFNQPSSYTMLTRAVDTGGHFKTMKGVKAGDSEDDLFRAYRNTGLTRYDDVPGDSWMKNDRVYGIDSIAGSYCRSMRFYILDGKISAMELQIAGYEDIFGEKGLWKDGYYVKAINSQKDCRIAEEGFRRYEKLPGSSAYDVSLPKIRDSLTGAGILNQQIQKDWAEVMGMPDRNFSNMADGFSDPVVKVYYEEYQIGDIFEVCVFYSSYSGGGSGVSYLTKRYVYDTAAGAPLTDDEFLAAMNYSQEIVVLRCLRDCLAEEDRKTADLTYEDVWDLYYIDEDGQIRFFANFYA